MALSHEDKKDVSAAFGKKAANAVSKATHDAKSKALGKKMGKESLSSKSSRASDRSAIMRAHGVKTDADRAKDRAALAKRKSDRGMFY